MSAADPSAVLAEAKRAARVRALDARARCDPAAGAALAAVILAEAAPPPGAVVAGFWPIGQEIDLCPLLHALAARGHRLVLPVTPARRAGTGGGTDRRLRFRLWQKGTALRREAFGTMAPDGPELDPSFLLVPLLAFDRMGNRLGYGGGYYDYTLGALPNAVALGCAYAAQEMADVPAGPRDVRLAAIATERGLVRAAGMTWPGPGVAAEPS